MKSLEKLYEEIRNSEEMKKEFTSSFKEGGVEEFLKAHDCDASAEDVMKYMQRIREGAVTDDDLDQVAGGCATTFSCNDSCYCWSQACY